MRNVSDKRYEENQYTHFVINLSLSLSLSLFANRAVYEIVRKNIAELGRPQMTIWRMRFACWFPKATSVRTEYVIFTDFRLKQWLPEPASMLRCTYIVCLVKVLPHLFRQGY
jgi:hypothetical protein